MIKKRKKVTDEIESSRDPQRKAHLSDTLTRLDEVLLNVQQTLYSEDVSVRDSQPADPLPRTTDVSTGKDFTSLNFLIADLLLHGIVYRSSSFFIHSRDCSKVAYGGLLQWASSSCGGMYFKATRLHGY
jgi:hypothetical protein